MPDLHRAAQAYLFWTVESDADLVNLPSVAFYTGNGTDVINWIPAEWVGVSEVVDGMYRRRARALVAGPSKVTPSEQAIVLPSTGTWKNFLRITDNPEEIPLQGEPVKVTS